MVKGGVIRPGQIGQRRRDLSEVLRCSRSPVWIGFAQGGGIVGGHVVSMPYGNILTLRDQRTARRRHKGWALSSLKYQTIQVIGNANAPLGNTLYNDPAKMKKYDIVFLPCEGGANDKSKAADQNLIDYTSIGGRVFTTHYGYQWLHLNDGELPAGTTPFKTTGNWQPEQQPDHYGSPLPVTINQSFPKGAAFAQWLVNVQASTTLGTMDIVVGEIDR